MRAEMGVAQPQSGQLEAARKEGFLPAGCEGAWPRQHPGSGLAAPGAVAGLGDGSRWEGAPQTIRWFPRLRQSRQRAPIGPRRLSSQLPEPVGLRRRALFPVYLCLLQTSTPRPEAAWIQSRKSQGQCMDLEKHISVKSQKNRLLPGCATWRKLLNLYDPQFPYLKTEP